LRKVKASVTSTSRWVAVDDRDVVDPCAHLDQREVKAGRRGEPVSVVRQDGILAVQDPVRAGAQRVGQRRTDDNVTREVRDDPFGVVRVPRVEPLLGCGDSLHAFDHCPISFVVLRGIASIADARRFPSLRPGQILG
jgi:hypothetical protein